jgi:hypothetical protein
MGAAKHLNLSCAISAPPFIPEERATLMPGSSPGRHRIGWGVLLLAAGWLYTLNPEAGRFYPTCTFHSVTGLLCPGCGCLRASHQLLHGHFIAALHYNIVWVVGLCLWPLWMAVQWFRNGTLTPWPTRIGGKTMIAVGGCLLIFWVARNLPFAKALWLAP